MQLVKQVSLAKDIAVCVQVDSKELIVRKVGILTYNTGFTSPFVCLFKYKKQTKSPYSPPNPTESVFKERILPES